MRKICVITSTRADYGLLEPLIEQINSDKDLTLQLIVTGTHLSYEFGNTYEEIEKRFKIDKKIVMDLSKDTPIVISQSMAKLQADMSEVFTELEPDIVVLLGDRYEMLSVAISAMMLNIPIAHIHGGESTEGAQDEAIRHSITKMSHMHFCATKIYRDRIIQLGENPYTVHNVGSLGVENIKNTELLSKKAFEKSIGFKLGKKNLLITFHPTTLESQNSAEQFKEILDALDLLEDTTLIFTKANADTNGKTINSMIDAYVLKHSSHATCHTSLGQLRYLSALQFVDGVVGNSSSGIIEAPSFNIATINIGDRQKGRERAKSIIDVSASKNNILHAIHSIYTPEFQNILGGNSNPYQGRDTSYKIKELLKSTVLTNLLKKSFYNLAPKINKVLVVSVHPDDETLGCGGTLLKHKDAGDETHWLICTHVNNNREFSAVRDEEIKEVSKSYQFNSVTNLMLDTMRVDEYSMSELVQKISQVIKDVEPNIIYLPFRGDVHSDHRVIFDATYSCTKSFRYPFIEKLYMMETLSETEFAPVFKDDIFIPNMFVNIDKYIDIKIDIMKIYKSEIQEPPFPRSTTNIRALATFRGASSGCKHAESFMLLKEIRKG